MAEKVIEQAQDGEKVLAVTGQQEPSSGSVGLETQVPGQATSVSEAANASGGIAPGHLIETDIDERLYKFQSDDTPLMQLMLRAKKVDVKSPEVLHYMIDEPKTQVTVTSDVAASSNGRAVLPLASTEAEIPRPFGTLLCQGVDGYAVDGKTVTVGKPLMLYVVGQDTTTNCPIVRAVNGPKENETDDVCTMPAIPAGTVCVILANACHETQKNVDPDLVIPKPRLLFLQKRIMNQVVSDYFESQRKQTVYTKALIAEQAIANFKKRTNRTLWIGRQGKLKIDVPGMGMQDVYFTEGIRWQFVRELMKSGAWTYEEFIALAKMYYTGEDIPETALCLCGKNFLESIQKIDWSKHPEVKIVVDTNKLGWKVTRIHTVFGDFEFKREPTLDRIGCSNSAAIIGEDRLVRYSRVSEHSFNEKIDGQEATRSGIIQWDGLGLKGACHIWVNGEDDTTTDSANTGKGITKMEIVYCSDISEITPVDGYVYYFMENCTIDESTVAKAGELWKYSDGKWSLYTGEIFTAA